MIAESIAENGNMACIDMAKNGAFPLAGAAGFEPANAGTKNRCLTTWRRPSRRRAYSAGNGVEKG